MVLVPRPTYAAGQAAITREPRGGEVEGSSSRALMANCSDKLAGRGRREPGRGVAGPAADSPPRYQKVAAILMLHFSALK